jgi:hypothetical protein
VATSSATEVQVFAAWRASMCRKACGPKAGTGDRTGQSNARGIGWEFVHVCVDDHSRLGFSQVLASERKEDAIAFLKAGSCLVSKDGDQGGTRDDGQWLLLSFEGIQQNL